MASGNRKISELSNKTVLNSHQDNLWLPVAQYNENLNTYSNIAVNIKAITNYSNSYSSYYINKLNDYLSYRLDSLVINDINNQEVEIEEIDYQRIYDECYAYTYNLVNQNNETLLIRISYLISNSKKTNTSSNSYIRNSSKKISELDSRDTITKHQDHSWFAVAQYDGRTNSYHNIAMNVKTLTSYSIDTITDNLGDVNNLVKLTYANNDNLSYYINNSYIAQNIVTYSFSYAKDYLDWQIL